MSHALVPATATRATICGHCGGMLDCGNCMTGDLIRQAKEAVSQVIRSKDPGRNAMARISAAKMVLAKDFLQLLSDEDLLSEVRRRASARAKAKHG